MPEGVLCTVSNCTFWDEGNLCGAEKIIVEVDKHAKGPFDTEFASMDEMHQDVASDSSTTCCYTFRPRHVNERK